MTMNKNELQRMKDSFEKLGRKSMENTRDSEGGGTGHASSQSSKKLLFL